MRLLLVGGRRQRDAEESFCAVKLCAVSEALNCFGRAWEGQSGS